MSAPGGNADEQAAEAAAEAWARVDHAALAQRLGAERAEAEGGARAGLAALLGIVFRLRDADGCPWDRQQTLDSMARHLAEEAAETADAIAAGDDRHACEELGDTLMNVFLMARIAEQEGRFDLAAVTAGIAEKLVRRHPHVFGALSAADADAALASWDASKAREAGTAPRSALDGVAQGLPALLLALKTSERAARTGFDWPDEQLALDKVAEELFELREEVERGRARSADAVPGRADSGRADLGNADPARAGAAQPGGVAGGTAGAEAAPAPAPDAGSASAARPGDRVEQELGDLLFATTVLARKLGRDPELALRRAVQRFASRFRALEAELGGELSRRPLPELLAAWRAVRRGEAGT